MIIWMVGERVRLRHSVNNRLLALSEVHPKGLAPVARRGWARRSGTLAYGRPAIGVASLL
jgi:hypothetical protein